jgi:hypothetical protein
MVEEVKSPIYATSVGLVLRGLNGYRTQGRESENFVAVHAGDGKKAALFDRIKDWLKDEADIPDFK